MTAIMLLILSPSKTTAQGYVKGVNITYEHMPMKVETPAGDRKFTGNNPKISTSIPIFLTPNKSKYLIIGGNLEVSTFQAPILLLTSKGFTAYLLRSVTAPW